MGTSVSVAAVPRPDPDEVEARERKYTYINDIFPDIALPVTGPAPSTSTRSPFITTHNDGDSAKVIDAPFALVDTKGKRVEYEHLKLNQAFLPAWWYLASEAVNFKFTAFALSPHAGPGERARGVPAIVDNPSEVLTLAEVSAGDFGDVWTGTMGREPVLVLFHGDPVRFACSAATLHYANTRPVALPVPRLVALGKRTEAGLFDSDLWSVRNTSTMLQFHAADARNSVPTAHELFVAEGCADSTVAQKLVCAVMMTFALKCLHKAGVIHNDVTLHNVFTNGKTCFQVGGLELAQVVNLERMGAFANGEVPFIHTQIAAAQSAPETLDRRVVSFASDVWQLGWALHHLMAPNKENASAGDDFVSSTFVHLWLQGQSSGMTRATSVESLRNAVAEQRPEQPAEDTCPELVWSMITRCLSRDPEMRPTLDEIIESLGIQLGALDDRYIGLDALLQASDSCAAAYATCLEENHRAGAALLSESFAPLPIDYALFEELAENKTDAALKLSRAKLNGDAGARALAKVLRLNTSVKQLTAADLGIKAEGAGAIGEALRLNGDLLELDLSSNELDDEACKNLESGIRDNAVLEVLDLRRNKIGDDGARAIADALAMNLALKSVKLGGNNVSEATQALVKYQCKERIDFA